MLPKAIIDDKAMKFLMLEHKGVYYLRAYQDCRFHFQILERFLNESKFLKEEVKVHGGGRITDSPDGTTKRLSKKSDDYGPVPRKLQPMLAEWVKECFPTKEVDIQTLTTWD